MYKLLIFFLQIFLIINKLNGDELDIDNNILNEPEPPPQAKVIIEPEVTVQEGVMKGKFMTTKQGRKIKAFTGIPYALPPIRELRFKPPVPQTPWDGIFDATKIHPVCPQRDVYRRTSKIEGQEDCLYLNVYTPTLTPSEPFPVMIFLHGGGWLCGSGNTLWYGPGILLDRDVVLVTLNFRLGALGFASTGDSVLPGNLGLKDQNLAFHWVKNNIARFGGNPDRITLFGESAGGASVQFHMASPLSRDLFHGAISQSGTADSSWAISENDETIRHTIHLAKTFSCPTSDSSKMIECLTNIDALAIVDQDAIFMKWDTDPMIPFKPVIEPKVDGAFLTEHPRETLKRGEMAKVPWIIGLNSEDGTLRAAALVANASLLEEFDRDFNKIVPMSLFYAETATNVALMTHKLRKFYFGEERINQSHQDALVNLYTDGWFLEGADESVRRYKKYTNQNVYYYLFGHRGANSFSVIFGDPVRNYGVCHADELQYLFPIDLWPESPMTEVDNSVAELMSKLWVNFARTGIPTSQLDEVVTRRWYPVQSDAMEYYLIQNQHSEMKEGLYLDRARFWRNLPTLTRHKTIKDEL